MKLLSFGVFTILVGLLSLVQSVVLPMAKSTKAPPFNTATLIHPTHTHTQTDSERLPHHSSASLPGHTHVGHPRGEGETDSVPFHTDTFKQPTLTRTGSFIISTYHPQFTGSASSLGCAHSLGFTCRAKDDAYRLTQIYSGTHSEYTLHSVNPEHTDDTTPLSGMRSLLHATYPGIFRTTAHPDSVSRRAEVSDIPGPVLCTRHSATIPGAKSSISGNIAYLGCGPLLVLHRYANGTCVCEARHLWHGALSDMTGIHGTVLLHQTYERSPRPTLHHQLNITGPCRVEQNIDMPDAWNGGDIIRNHTRYICGTGSVPLLLPNGTCDCILRPKGYGGPEEVTKTHCTSFSTGSSPGQSSIWTKPCPPFATCPHEASSAIETALSATQSDTFVAPPTHHNLPTPIVGSLVPLLTLFIVTDSELPRLLPPASSACRG
jgi:hypothetical protein